MKTFHLPTKKTTQHAFTLIELLVVMVIVVVLAAILLPVLGKSRDKARNIQCLNNLKQLGVATRLYAEDDSGILPAAEILPSNPTNPQNPLPRICDLLGRYAGTPVSSNLSAPVFKCPKDNDYFYEVEGSSYQWNTAINGRRIDNGENHQGHMIMVSNGVVLLESNINNTLGTEHTTFLLDYDDFHPRPPKTGKNAVYMDGHAAGFEILPLGGD